MGILTKNSDFIMQNQVLGTNNSYFGRSQKRSVRSNQFDLICLNHSTLGCGPWSEKNE